MLASCTGDIYPVNTSTGRSWLEVCFALRHAYLPLQEAPLPSKCPPLGLNGHWDGPCATSAISQLAARGDALSLKDCFPLLPMAALAQQQLVAISQYCRSNGYFTLRIQPVDITHY